MTRCVVRFKDGTHCNLEADSLVTTDEYLQAWYGENRLVGIFLLSEVCIAYLSEKLLAERSKQ